MTVAPHTVRRLRAADAGDFKRVRMEGLRLDPDQFRIALADEDAVAESVVAARLEAGFVVGGFIGGELMGVGGLSRSDGAKMRHRALLWGMYVRAAARGSGLADAIVSALLDQARAEGIVSVVLTVIGENGRALRLYARSGFVPYGTEPRAVWTGERYLDEVLMIRRMDDREGTR